VPVGERRRRAPRLGLRRQPVPLALLEGVRRLALEQRSRLGLALAAAKFASASPSRISRGKGLGCARPTFFSS